MIITKLISLSSFKIHHQKQQHQQILFCFSSSLKVSNNFQKSSNPNSFNHQKSKSLLYFSSSSSNKAFFSKFNSKRHLDALFKNQKINKNDQQPQPQHQTKLDVKNQQIMKKFDEETAKIRALNRQKVLEIQKKTSNMIKAAKEKYNQQQFEQAEQKIHLEAQDKILKINQFYDQKLENLQDVYMLNFHKAKKEYELDYVKNYMLKNMEPEDGEEGEKINSSNSKHNVSSSTVLKSNGKTQSSTSSSTNTVQPGFIPKNIILKKLAHRLPNGQVKQILLAGVQSNNEQHCLYTKKLIQKLQIGNCLTIMSPDMPYFINSPNYEDNFIIEWRRFLAKPSPMHKFYLNPNPKVLQDIRLQKRFIQLVTDSMCKSRSFVDTQYSLMQFNETNYHYEHQPLLTGLKCGNTVDGVYFCDYPFMKEREMIAMSMDLGELRQLIKAYAHFKQIKKQHFSAELLLPKNIMNQKFKHIISVAKTVSRLSGKKPSILLCNADMSQVLSEHWKNQNIGELEYSYESNHHYLNIQTRLNSFRSQPELPLQQQNVPFIQFIQKLVILDIIISPLIQNYFVAFKSFPYSGEKTIGGLQNIGKVFLIWNHYYTLYKKAADNVGDLMDDKQKTYFG